MSQALNDELIAHLVRADGQEDLAFAIWYPSIGELRDTALIQSWIPPLRGDRDVHGNVSFHPVYFERACSVAMQRGGGVAFLHSHPFPGWQGMSDDDVVAERKLMGAALGLTGFPLVGLTVGSDGVWSARVWPLDREAGECSRQWCSSVRVVSASLRAHFSDELRPAPGFSPLFRRTVEMWGPEAHRHLSRLRVGIVGLGSVGGIVAEALARMGCSDLVLIDFDKIEPHNLDRLVYAHAGDIDDSKVRACARRLREIATSNLVEVREVSASVAEDPGYAAALDCDVLFSCVDRPLPRQILNHLAYAHLIPVIDGGIAARFRAGVFRGADWQAQTVGPTRRCLECLRAFSPADAATERAGKLDDPTYLSGLPSDHPFKRNENVFPFSLNLASMEVMQLVALTTGAAGIDNFGAQRYRFVPGIMELVEKSSCDEACDMHELVAFGDKHFALVKRSAVSEDEERAEV